MFPPGLPAFWTNFKGPERRIMKLFEPLTIRGMSLKNRIILPAMGYGSQEYGTEAGNRIIGMWAEWAAGGAGCVIQGAVAPSSLISDEELGQGIPSSQYIAALGRLAEAVHQGGAKLGVQLWHTNQYPAGQIGPARGNQEWVAPSAKIYKGTEGALVYMPSGEDIPLRELRRDEIEAIIRRFALASRCLQERGIDFVELHLAHGHLPNQFFSPATNGRNDRYGGDLTRRMRFGLECVAAMREATGDSYPIFVRFAARDEDVSRGITLDDSVLFARELEKAGADCLDVSVGAPAGSSYANWVCPPRKSPAGAYVHLADAIKKCVTIPVAVVGKINSAILAEEVLCEGKADLVAIGRQLICDAEWPKKVAEGRQEEIIECDACNTYCWGIGPQGGPPPVLCRKRKKNGAL